MDLAQELAKFRADFERTAPAGRAALYDAKVEELGANFPLSAALAVGDIAPKFALPNARRRQISLSEMLQKGPAVVTFAAADIGSLQIAGLPAWLLWSTAHIYFLVGFRNRIVVGANWQWNYLTFERGARLITGMTHAERHDTGTVPALSQVLPPVA